MYVVLAPVMEKTVGAIAHALIAHSICTYLTPSNNGKELCNAHLEVTFL